MFTKSAIENNKVMSFGLSNELSALSYQNLYAFIPPGAKIRSSEIKKSFLIIFKVT